MTIIEATSWVPYHSIKVTTTHFKLRAGRSDTRSLSSSYLKAMVGYPYRSFSNGHRVKGPSRPLGLGFTKKWFSGDPIGQITPLNQSQGWDSAWNWAPSYWILYNECSEGPVMLAIAFWRCRKPFSQCLWNFQMKAALPLAKRLATVSHRSSWCLGWMTLVWSNNFELRWVRW